MSLADRLHCPACQGRLDVSSATELRCSGCNHPVAIVNGVADFIGGPRALRPGTLGPGADRTRGVTEAHGLLTDLPARIKNAAGGRWPMALGSVIEFGCGSGVMTQAIITTEVVRSLLVIDADLHWLVGCRDQLNLLDNSGTLGVAFAALAPEQKAIRDAVADTVIGSVLLSGIGDVRGFLSMVHRVLKPSGRALFVVPNRRHHQAVCLAVAEALTQQFARDGRWPDHSDPLMRRLGELRRLLVGQDDPTRLNALDEKHLFASGTLDVMAEQIGYATAEMIPLDPDPAGAAMISLICRDAGTGDEFAAAFGPLAAAVGRPFFSLLSDADTSAFSLLWLTKAAGPMVRVYAGPRAGPAVVYPGPDAALGGSPPRWSLELLGRATQDGVMVKIGGWCLSNIDALDIRVTLDDSALTTPVWRHRPDVHEVLNREGRYHALNCLCSGVEDELWFADVHPTEDSCRLRVEILLAGGLTVSGPAPERLLMDQPTVIAH